MTAATLTSTPTPARSRPAGSLRRIGALARAEALLLRRSPMALLNAVAVPIFLVVLTKTSMPTDLPAGLGGIGTTIVTALVVFALVFAVYYNLVTTLVARREDLVLKRLRTGETSDAEILTAVAAPAVAIAWAQASIGVVASVTVLGMGLPLNPVLVVAAVVGGTVVLVQLAAASTALTRSVELAQVSTMPVLLSSMLLSGIWVPLDAFPEPVQNLAHLLPLTPVVDLLHLGLTGTTVDGSTVSLAGSFSSAAPSLLVLAAWVAVGAWATRRWLRWEPRR